MDRSEFLIFPLFSDLHADSKDDEIAKNVVACFSGHMHKDFFFKPFEVQEDRTNPLPTYQLVTKNPFPFPWQEDKYDIAFDLVLWNFSKKEITVLRFGDGEDKSF